MTPALDVLEAELLASGRGTDAVEKLRAAEAAAPRPTSARPPPRVHRDVRGGRGRRSAE